jgi:hypothetical protein
MKALLEHVAKTDLFEVLSATSSTLVPEGFSVTGSKIANPTPAQRFVAVARKPRAALR